MADKSRTVEEMEAEFAKSRPAPQVQDPVADMEAEYQRAKAFDKPAVLEAEYQRSKVLADRPAPEPVAVQAARGVAEFKPPPDLDEAALELQNALIEYNKWTNHPDPKGDAVAQVRARKMRRASADKSATITPFGVGEVAERVKAATEPGSVGYRAAEALGPKWYGDAAQTERRHYWRVAESEADRQLGRVVRQQLLMDQGVPKEAATIRAQAAYELNLPLMVPTQDNPRFSAGPQVDIGIGKVTELKNTVGQGVADLAAGTMDLATEAANLAKDVVVDAPLAIGAGVGRPVYEAVTGKEAPDPSKGLREWSFGSLTDAVADALPESAAKESLKSARERNAGILAGSAEVRNALLTPLGLDPLDPDGDGVFDVVSRLMLTQPREEMPAPTPTGEGIVSSTVENIASVPGVVAQGYEDMLTGKRSPEEAAADTAIFYAQTLTTPAMELFSSVSKDPGAQERESSLGWFLRVPATALSGVVTTQAARVADYWLTRSGATSQRRRRVPGDPALGFWEAHLPVIFTGSGLHDYATTLYNGDSFTSEWMRTADTAATLPGISDSMRSSLLPGGRWREGGTQLAMLADLFVPVDAVPFETVRGAKNVAAGVGEAARASALGMGIKEAAAMGAAEALPASWTHALMMKDAAYRSEWESMAQRDADAQKEMGVTEPVPFSPDADMVRLATARAYMRKMVDRGLNPVHTEESTPADRKALANSIREQLTMLKVRPEDIEAALAEVTGDGEVVEPAVGSVVPAAEADRLDAREAALADDPPLGTFTEAVTAAATPREKVIAGLEELATAWGMDPADPLVSRAFEAALSFWDAKKGAFRRAPEADEALLNRITDADATRALNRLRDASPAQVMENTKAFVLGAVPRWSDERIPGRARVRSEIIGRMVVDGLPLAVPDIDAFLTVTDRIADALVERGVIPSRDDWYARQSYTSIAPGSVDAERGRGFFQIGNDGRALIGLAQDANLSTLFHESAHLLRRILPVEHMEAVDAYVREQFGGWTVKAEEWFAVQFESVLTKGKISVAKADTITKKFEEALNKALRFAADVLRKVYEGGALPNVHPTFAAWMESFAGLKIEIEPVKADPPAKPPPRARKPGQVVTTDQGVTIPHVSREGWGPALLREAEVRAEAALKGDNKAVQEWLSWVHSFLGEPKNIRAKRHRLAGKNAEAVVKAMLNAGRLIVADMDDAAKAAADTAFAAPKAPAPAPALPENPTKKQLAAAGYKPEGKGAMVHPETGDRYGWDGEAKVWIKSAPPVVEGAKAPESALVDVASHITDPTGIDKDAFGGTNNVRDAVAWIAKNSDDPTYRVLAGKLVPILPDNVLLVIHQRETARFSPMKGVGYYETTSATDPGVVGVNGSTFGVRSGLNDETLLHEAVHVATVRRIRDGLRPNAATHSAAYRGAKMLEQVRLDLAEWRKANPKASMSVTLSGWHLIDDATELVAYALTDRNLRDVLKNIHLPGERQSLWTRFIEGVRTILGLAPDDDSVLARIIDATNVLLEDALGEEGKRIPLPSAAPWEAPLAAMSASSSTKDILAAVGPLADALGATKEERASLLAAVKNAIKNKVPVAPIANAFVSTKIRLPADVSPPPAPTLPDVLAEVPEPEPTTIPPTVTMPKAGTLAVDAYGQPRKMVGGVPFSIRKVKLSELVTEGVPPGVADLARTFNVDELDPTGVDPGVGAVTVREVDGKLVVVDGVRRAQALQELYRRGMAGEEPYRSVLAGVQSRTSAWSMGLGVTQALGDEVFVRVVDGDLPVGEPAKGLDVLGALPIDLADAASRAGEPAQARIAAAVMAIASLATNPDPVFQASAPLAALRDGMILYGQVRAAGGPPARWATTVRNRYVAVAGSKALPVSAPSVHVAVALGALSPDAFAAWLSGVAAGGPWARTEADAKAVADLPARHADAIEHARRLEMAAIEAAEAEKPVVTEPPGWEPEVGPKGAEGKLPQERIDADDPDAAAYGGARTAKGMVAWIAAKGSDPKLRAMARKILPLVPDNVTVRVIQPGRTYMFGPGKENIPQAMHSARGVFRWNTAEPDWAGDITLRGSGFDEGTLGLRDETILHEAIHAVVNRRIYEGNFVATPDGPAKRGTAMFYKINNDLVAWFNDQKRKGTLPDYANTAEFIAAMNSVNELTTYAFTNADVQAAFKQIRLPGERKSLWTRFIEGVRSILGLSADDDSVLARIIDATNVLLEDVLGPDGMPVEPPAAIEALEDGPGRLYQSRPKPRAVTLFSGGGLVEEGLRGLIDPVLAVESDADIAANYRDAHGEHVVVGDVRTAEIPSENVDYLHASPVCKNFSVAKTLTEDGEQPIDIETARATADAIRKAKPRVFTLENVKGYQGSEAMQIIETALREEGYTFDAAVYKAADYGAATRRERLLLRAVRGGALPPAPRPTHGPALSGLRPQADWYATVRDIVNDLPNAEVASWMKDRLAAAGVDAANVSEPMIVMGGSMGKNVPLARAGEPAPVIKATPREAHVILLPGGVVKRVTPRALARITGLPDSYPLPAKRETATTIIGNGVPPALTRAVFGPLIKSAIANTGTFDPENPSILYQERPETKIGMLSEQLRATKFIGPDLVATILTSDRPEYLDEVAKFVLEQREKARAGTFSPRDVAKAYVMTLASQQASAAPATFAHLEAGTKTVDSAGPDRRTAPNARIVFSEAEEAAVKRQRELGISEENIVRPQFHTLTPDGRPEVRPEETMAAWFFTPMGRRALDNLERGVWDAEAWEEGAQLRDVFGANILRSQGAYDQPRAAGQFTLRNIADFTKAVNAAKGDPKKVEAVLTKAQGVGRGKKPFIGHLLGFGENPTIDAVEIWGWVTGQGDRAAAVRAVGKYKADLARALKDNFGGRGGTQEKVSDLIEKRIRDGFQRLQKQGAPGTDMPEEVFGAIMHHWFWDKLKGTSTTHEGMMASQRFAQHRDYVASALPKVPAGSPPPPVPTGDVVSEVVGRDEPQEFYGASQDKEGVATPYGMRAVKDRAIPAYTTPSQLKRALGYRADQTRFNARDLVVRAGAYAILQKSQAKNARTKFMQVGNRVAVPMGRVAAVRARALAVLGDLPVRVREAVERRPALAPDADPETQPIGLSLTDAGRIRTLLNALDANGWNDSLPASIVKMTVTDIAEKMTTEDFRQFHGAVLDAQSGAAPYRGRVDRFAIAANLVWEFAQRPGSWFTPVPLPRDASKFDKSVHSVRSWVGARILSTAYYALPWEESHPDMRPDIRPLHERMRREMSQLPSRLAESLEALMERKHKPASPGAMQAEMEELARSLPGAVPPIGVNPRGDGLPSDLHTLRAWLYRDPPQPYGTATSVDINGNVVVNSVPHDFPRVGVVDPSYTTTPERPMVDAVAEVIAHEDVLNRVLNPVGRRIDAEVTNLLNQVRNRTIDPDGAALLVGHAYAALNAAREIGVKVLVAAAGHSGAKDKIANVVSALETGPLSGTALDAYEAFYQFRWTRPQPPTPGGPPVVDASIEALVRTLGVAPKTLPAPFWVFDILNHLNVLHLIEEFTDLAIDRNYVFNLNTMTEGSGIQFKDLRDRAMFAMQVKDFINAEMRGTDYVRVYGVDNKGVAEAGVDLDPGTVRSQQARYYARTIMAQIGLRPDVLATRKGYKGEMATSPVVGAWLKLSDDPVKRAEELVNPATYREAGKRLGLHGRDYYMSTVVSENLAEMAELHAPLAERLAVVLSNRESYSQFFDRVRDLYAQLKGSFITGGPNGVLAAAVAGGSVAKVLAGAGVLAAGAAVPQALALGTVAWGMSVLPRFPGFFNNAFGAVLQGVIELGWVNAAKAFGTATVPAMRAAQQSVRFHRVFGALDAATVAVQNLTNPRPPENVTIVGSDGRVYTIADVMTISRRYGLDETQARSESAETIRRKVDRLYETYEADPSFTGTVWRGLASFFGRYKITENYRRMYEMVDVFFRYVWLIRGLQEGLRPEDAVARSLRISFDYTATSQVDRWVNMIGMFWMYQRRALDLTLAALIEHPSTVFGMVRFMRAQDLTSGYADLNEEYERETETVPEYAMGRFGVAYLPVAGARTAAQKVMLVEPPNVTAMKLINDVVTGDPFMVASRANPFVAVGFNVISTTAGGPMVSMFRRSTAESPSQWKVPARFVMLDQNFNGGHLTKLFHIVPMYVDDGTGQPSDEMGREFYVGEQGRMLWDAYRSLVPGFSTWLSDVEMGDRGQGWSDELMLEVMGLVEGTSLPERQNYGSVFTPATDVQPRVGLGSEWEKARRLGLSPATISTPYAAEVRPVFDAATSMKEEAAMLTKQVERMVPDMPRAKEPVQPETVKPERDIGVDPNKPIGLERR